MTSRFLRTAVALLGLVTLLLASSPARADGPGEEPGPSYGWQTGLSDLAATALVVGPVALDSSRASRDRLGVGSLALYALGGPAIHLAHGHTRASLLDGALRIGSPLVGAAVAWGLYTAACFVTHPPAFDFKLSSNDTAQPQCSDASTWALGGAVAGMGVATAIDALVFADPTRIRDAKPRGASTAAKSASVGRAITFAPLQGGGAMSFVASW